MIESTCIEFYNVVTGQETAQNAMTDRQNEGWKIVSVFPWAMGTIGVVYNREMPLTVTLNGEPASITDMTEADVSVITPPAKRIRKAR